LVVWFRATFPDVLIYAIPNGEHRSISTGKRLKDEGVLAGMPDLHIPAWGLWVEMKRTKCGHLSSTQSKIHAYLRSVGQTVIVGFGATDASRQILEYRSPVI
jgi:hypothetical protein